MLGGLNLAAISGGNTAVNHVVTTDRWIRLHAWVAKHRNLFLAFWQGVIKVNMVNTVTLATFLYERETDL